MESRCDDASFVYDSEEQPTRNKNKRRNVQHIIQQKRKNESGNKIPPINQKELP